MNNSIEIVIVLYQCSLDKSVTFLTLKEQLKSISVDFELIIFNNDINQKTENEEYLVVNSEENQKIAGAYNFALERAIKKGMKWILLLDQDTVIPDNYFKELDKLFSGNYCSDLVAIVPILELNGRVLSPKRISSKMRFEHDINKTGYTKERLNAFNSLSLFDVQFIKSVGGFNKNYPLDMHDHWCYNQVYKHQKSVYILDVTSEHESSFIDFERNVSIPRYKEFLRTEDRFIRNELGIFVYLFYKMKILLRSVKQFINYKNKKYSLVTFLSVFKF